MDITTFTNEADYKTGFADLTPDIWSREIPALEKSNGHLTVIKGFDGKGKALMHEPAAPSDKEVPRSYDCAQLESRWLEASGGICYIISPRTL